MRFITSKEEAKFRGCTYCADNISHNNQGIVCKHDKCPYHELDNTPYKFDVNAQYYRFVGVFAD